jgi:RNA polymerase sigma factor (sigma-70 family)
MALDADSRTDAELLAGDGEAFGLFYARHEDYVLGLFVRRVGTGGAELAADLTAETFASALASRGSFDPARGEPRGWLYGIARHVLADSLEHGQVQDRARLRLRLERLEIDDEAIARIEELSGDVALAALAGLPEDQRLAVRGRVIDGIGYGELAQSLRCSPSVARKRVSRGLRTLRQRLEER